MGINRVSYLEGAKNKRNKITKVKERDITA